MVPITPPRCFGFLFFFFLFSLARRPHLLWQPRPARTLAWRRGHPEANPCPGETLLSSSLRLHFDLVGAHPRGAGVVPLSGSPLPFVPSPCPRGELEAEPHWVCLLPKPARASSRRGEGAWGKPWGLHAARGWGWRTSPRSAEPPAPLTPPLSPLISQRPDSEALEREEVARWVQLGTAEDWKKGQEGDGRVPRPCYRDPVIDRSSARGWDLLCLARRGG